MKTLLSKPVRLQNSLLLALLDYSPAIVSGVQFSFKDPWCLQLVPFEFSYSWLYTVYQYYYTTSITFYFQICSEDYVIETGNMNKPRTLVGSWTVTIGDQDQCLHLWRYENGYSGVDAFKREALHNNVSLQYSGRTENSSLRTANLFLWPYLFYKYYSRTFSLEITITTTFVYANEDYYMRLLSIPVKTE